MRCTLALPVSLMSLMFLGPFSLVLATEQGFGSMGLKTSDMTDIEALNMVLSNSKMNSKTLQDTAKALIDILERLAPQPMQAGAGDPHPVSARAAPNVEILPLLYTLYPIVAKARKCGACCTCARGDPCVVILFSELQRVLLTSVSRSAFSSQFSAFDYASNKVDDLIKLLMARAGAKDDVSLAVEMAIDSCIGSLCGECQFCRSFASSPEVQLFILTRRLKKMSSAERGAGLELLIPRLLSARGGDPSSVANILLSLYKEDLAPQMQAQGPGGLAARMGRGADRPCPFSQTQSQDPQCLRGLSAAELVPILAELAKSNNPSLAEALASLDAVGPHKPCDSAGVTRKMSGLLSSMLHKGDSGDVSCGIASPGTGAVVARPACPSQNPQTEQRAPMGRFGVKYGQ